MLIFVSLFAGFYVMQVSYAFMVVGVTTMLALLYGLLGEFSVALLLTRIEETAIGAAIGILTAVFVLPTSTHDTVRDDIRCFVAGLGELVGRVADRLVDGCSGDLTAQARDLDQRLSAVRTSARPLIVGVTGLGGSGSHRRGYAVLLGCDHYARGLVQVARPASGPAVRAGLRDATERVTGNLQVLAGLLDHDSAGVLHPADEALDAAQNAIDATTASDADARRLSTSVHYLRQIDLAVVGLSRELTGRTSRRQATGRAA